MRVYQLAKELNVASKDFVAFLVSIGIDVKGHMSGLTEDEVVVVREKWQAAAAKEVPAQTDVKKDVKPEPVKEDSAPAAVKQEEDKEAVSKKAKPAKKHKPARYVDLEDEEEGDDEDDLYVRSKSPKKKKKKNAADEDVEDVALPEPKAPASVEAGASSLPASKTKISVVFPITVGTLAEKMNRKPNELIAGLMKQKIFASITQSISEDNARRLLEEFGFELEEKKVVDAKAGVKKKKFEAPTEEDLGQMESRAPIATMMGHVDHGKTSLLDAIRNTAVAAREAGGITQHIGAYEVRTNHGKVVFIDTPGHEAFTAMRARGANVTDVVVLVVAADDGLMPQSIEAINHAKAANVPIIVAINKIDKAGANPQNVKMQLMEHGLVSEEWGGKTICVEVSALTKQGIPDLIEMLILESEMLELKANPRKKARGVVLEGHLHKGRGAVASVIVMSGTLKVGDIMLADKHYGKVRALVNDQGKRVDSAGPATPVEVLGLSGVPTAGDHFEVVDSEKEARDMQQIVLDEQSEQDRVPAKAMTLEDLYAQISSGDIKELNIILKADNTGSLEALRDSLMNLSTDAVELKVIHQGIGAISEADITLAKASQAIVIGFCVDADAKGRDLALEKGVQVRSYKIIYEVIDDVKKAMEGVLDHKEKEVKQGTVEVRATFKSSKFGVIAGCYVLKGKIMRNSRVRLYRNDEVLYDGKIGMLRRGKDDVKEVAADYECGVLLEKFNDIQEGDILNVYQIEFEKQFL